VGQRHDGLVIGSGQKRYLAAAVMLQTVGRGNPHRIVLMQNWDEEVTRLLPR
jgi:hypothetical protein